MTHLRLVSKYILFFCASLFFVTACKNEPKKTTETVLVSNLPTNTITVRLRAEPDMLNPILTYRSWSLEVINQIFPTLLNIDPETEKLAPFLAKSLPQVVEVTEGKYAGNEAYIYEIRPEAVWDNGTPVLASDYEFTLKTIFNPNVNAGAYRGLLDFIAAVEIDPTNPKKFKVITNKRYINAKSYSGFYIIPAGQYDPDGLMKNINLNDLIEGKIKKTDNTLVEFANQFNTKYNREKAFISGAGAYQLEEWVEGQKIVLTKKENWWGDKVKDKNNLLLAYPDKIIFKFFMDDGSALSMLQNEEIDVMTRIPNTQFIALEKDENFKTKYTLHRAPSLGYAYYAFNTQRPKLSDKRVRRALAYLTNVDEIIATAKVGLAQPAITFLNPKDPYYNQSLKRIEYNPSKAKELLAAAGWTDTNGNGIVDKKIDGELVEMNLELLTTANNQTADELNTVFKEGAIKGGVNIVLNKKEAKQTRVERSKRNFDIVAGAAIPDLNLYDPIQFWHTSSDNPNGSNFAGFGTAKTDKLIEELRQTTNDEVKLKELYGTLQEIIYDEQPVVFIYRTIDCMAFHKKFKSAKFSLKSPGYHPNTFK